MSKQAHRLRAWTLWAYICVLGLAGCAAVPRARWAAYRDISGWLQAHALPAESVAVQERSVWARFTDHPLLVLPSGADTFTLLDHLERERPDYCVALRSVAWQGVQAAPWFQEHYRQVAVAAATEDPASPVTLYRYHDSPFDAGEVLTLEQVIEDEDVGRMDLRSLRISKHRLTPGEPVYVSLTLAGSLREPLSAVWRLRDPASDRIWLQDVHAQPGGTSTDAWPAAAMVTERYTVVPPAGLPEGDYALELTFVRPNRAPFGDPLLLATVYNPAGVSHVPPTPDHVLELTAGEAIALVGYDAPAQLAQGDSLRVALYWHAQGTTEQNLKVFIHVYGPEGVAGQSDAIPVGWTYPTTGWKPGEYIRDAHVIAPDPALPRGDYRIMVGMVDAETGERLPLYDAQGQPLTDNIAPLYVLRVR